MTRKKYRNYQVNLILCLVDSGAPDFEVYSEGDMNSDNYEMELWVPVVKE